MGGVGRAPKLPGERRRYNQPMRGEWVDLEPLDEPILGPFDREQMTLRERLWNGWRNDPVTSQYGEADIAAIYELAATWSERAFADRDRMMDKLGLTPKGKRDLRWRTPNEVKTIKKQTEKAPVRHIRAVGEQK
jgi:hypothetical protein